MAGTIESSQFSGKEEVDTKEEEELIINNTSLWSELLPELLIAILSNLNTRDSFVVNRMICKSWELFTSRLSLPSPTNEPLKSPYLICLVDDVCKFYHPLYRGCYRMDADPDLSKFQIRFSKYGWLLLTGNKRHDDRVFLYNPFKNVKIELPSKPDSTDTVAMAFSCDPASPECFIVGITWWGQEFIIIKRGQSQWTRRVFKRPFHLSNCPPVVINGKCYCLGLGGDVGEFDPNYIHGAPVWNVFAQPFEDLQDDEMLDDALFYSTHRQSFMAETNRELFRVLVLHEDRQVQVSKLNLAKKIWSPVHSMGDKRLHVSIAGSFMEKAKSEIMRNHIYFPKVRGNDCIIYSLAVKRYISFCCDYNSKNCFHTSDLRNCAWIQPTSSTFNMKEEFTW